MSKKIHFSEQTKHKVSILPYFLRIGKYSSGQNGHLSLSKTVHTDKEYRFKNNKTINQIFEDKQREREKDNLSRVAVRASVKLPG